jgi:competence protein ComFC
MWQFLVELLFPKFCFGCQKEGSYLCSDCRATLEILSEHRKYSGENLTDLFWAVPYQGFLIKRLIHSFKYEPFAKELSRALSLLIINHFQLIENPPSFLTERDFILIPVPLYKKRLKWRGFNQAEKIGRELSSYLKMPLISDSLVKIKETPPQVELAAEARKENIREAFLIKKRERINGRKVLLVDDIFTTGSTIEEAARILKKEGVKEIIGIVIARG